MCIAVVYNLTFHTPKTRDTLIYQIVVEQHFIIILNNNLYNTVIKELFVIVQL